MGNSKVCQNLKSQAGQIARYFKNVKESVVNVCVVLRQLSIYYFGR